MFTALRGREDAARVRGQERRHQDARKAEEQEHPLARGRVVPRHRERVRDVVDQVVLPGTDALDEPGDPLRLLQGGPRVRLQPGSIDQHVQLQHREALDLAADRCPSPVEGRDDLASKDLRGDDDRVRHVEELLELAGLSAGEQRLRTGQIDHAAHRQGKPIGATRDAQLGRGAGLRRECRGRLGAQKGRRRPEASGDDAYRGVVLLIPPIEGEHTNRMANGGAADRERTGRKIDEAEPVRGGNPRDRLRPRSELLERQHLRRVRRGRLHLLATGDRAPEPKRSDIADGPGRSS